MRDQLLFPEREGHYLYYKHGPLARTEVGQLRVQGMDYAYTLQGWLKGVNPTMGGTLSNGTDTTEPYPVAQDVYGFSLGYYQNDYKAIGYAPQATSVLGALGTNAAPLFNGNIAAMGVNIPKLSGTKVYDYHYDQLNRIVAMDMFNGLSPTAGTFTAVSDTSYKERISYDPNGNILTYLRNGDIARPTMDNLSYVYNPGTNQLNKVTDGATDAGATYSQYNDIKQGQGNNNYQYDAIGNLSADASESITNISWSVYGKILSITKSGAVIRYVYDVGGNRIMKQTAADTTVYVRDAGGNVMSVYVKKAGQTLQQTEMHLYGSSRLGMAIQHMAPDSTTALSGGFGVGIKSIFTRGEKLFELTNHLGNVLVTITDRRMQTSAGGVTVDSYAADIVTASDYYPFGMPMPSRNYTTSSGYRYGFNGKENDNEVSGIGNQYDYGFRIYDPRLVRFKSVDPLSRSYPWNSPYSYAEGDLIRSIDLDGLEKYIIHQRSFAPWEFFGEIATGGKYKYSGDHRGFSVASDNDIKSKVSTAITVDIATAKAELTTSKQFGNTVRYNGETGEALKTAPRVNPEVSLWNPQKDGNSLTVKARIEGKAPLAPFPILDPISSAIDQPIVWTGTTTIENHISQGYINVTYNYIGKGFPAFESFIEDQKGTKLFMAINISPAKTNIIAALSGSEWAYANTFKMKIATGAQGNFNGVYGKDANGNEIVRNPAVYNKIFEAVPAAKDLPK